MRDSVLNSLDVALAAVVLALASGLPAALALDRVHFPVRRSFGGWCCCR